MQQPALAGRRSASARMRCCSVRCCHAGPATQAAYVNLLAAALSASPALQQSGLPVQLQREPERLDDDELERVASSSALLSSRPIHAMASRLWQWRVSGDFPPNPEVPDLVEISEASELYCHLTPLAREADDASKLAALLEALGPWGIQALLGCRRTAGTIEQLPPAPAALVTAFTRRHSPSAPLTVGARALAKHVHRSPKGFWADGTISLRGSDAQKNAHALALLEGLLRDAVWMNVHALPGGNAEGQTKVAVFELRQREGYGARWSADGLTFRGFVEPQAWDVERRAAEAADDKVSKVTSMAEAKRNVEAEAKRDVEAEAALAGVPDSAEDQLVRTLGLERCCNAGWLTIAGCTTSEFKPARPLDPCVRAVSTTATFTRWFTRGRIPPWHQMAH